jgi:NAD(P)-dependent dehydrogenase (short-subunit alcohol dehydrogenase family)
MSISPKGGFSVTNLIDLSSKHILVTGASRGIGRAVAVQLGQLGAKVSLVARNSAGLEETLSMMDGDGHSIYRLDLRDTASIEPLVREVVSEGGSLSGLVHAAGLGTKRPLIMASPEFVHEMMLVNLYSFIELARAFSKKNNHEASASIVGISSVAGVVPGGKSMVAYCASKSAMDGAMRALAVELSGKGIRVNTVAPGFIRTAMIEEYVDLVGQEAFERNVLSRQYLGVGEPSDVASAVAYLLSDAARFITGTTLVVDGGYLSY